MNNISEIVKLPQNTVNESKDYTDSEGFLMCGKCKSRKEQELKMPGGEKKIISLRCKCREAEQKEEQRQKELKELRQRIEMNKEKYVKDKQYLSMTFDKADKDSSLEWAINYVKAWEDIKHNENAGLLLYGDTGTGKTFAACCIANALIDKGVSVMVANIVDLIDAVSGFDNIKKEEVIENIKNCSLLIIDDFGATRDTDFANEQVYKIIDARYRTKKPMIITTNLAPKLMNSDEIIIELKRTYQRVLERCTLRLVNCCNRRTSILKQNKNEMEKILKGEYAPAHTEKEEIKKACQGE